MALAQTAEQREEIWQAHHERMTQIEAEFHNRSISLQVNYGAQFADIMMGMVNDSSSAYAALASIQKGFSLFSTIMNGYTAISAAWASAPFPYNMPAVITTTMETGILQSAVAALSPKGFQTGGYTGNYGKSEVAGVVHGQEYVLNAEATRRVGINTLNAINSGADIQAERQAQANVKAMPQQSQPQVIDNNLRVIMVKDENEAKDWLYSSDGEKAFLYHMKRNRSKI